MIFEGYLHNLLQRERRKFAFSLQQLGFFTGKKFLLGISILWQVQKFAWLSTSWVKAIDISVLWPTYSWDLVAGILRQIRMGCCKYFNSFSPLRRRKRQKIKSRSNWVQAVQRSQGRAHDFVLFWFWSVTPHKCESTTWQNFFSASKR